MWSLRGSFEGAERSARDGGCLAMTGGWHTFGTRGGGVGTLSAPLMIASGAGGRDLGRYWPTSGLGASVSQRARQWWEGWHGGRGLRCWSREWILLRLQGRNWRLAVNLCVRVVRAICRIPRPQVSGERAIEIALGEANRRGSGSRGPAVPSSSGPRVIERVRSWEVIIDPGIRPSRRVLIDNQSGRVLAYSDLER